MPSLAPLFCTLIINSAGLACVDLPPVDGAILASEDSLALRPNPHRGSMATNPSMPTLFSRKS